MTPLPDIINRNINEYAPAMDALAKGEEMTICVHNWEFVNYESQGIVCTKCGAYLDGTDAINRLNILESDNANLRARFEQPNYRISAALRTIKQYRAQLAERDALIERLVEAGNDVCMGYAYAELDSKPADEWVALVSEWQAMKGGEG